MVKIIPDLLPAQHFAEIEHLFMKHHLPWFFNDRVVSTERHFMFSHIFMDNGQVINQRFYEPVRGMIPEIMKHRNFVGVSRIRAVLYTNQGEEIIHPTHTDIPPESEIAPKFITGVYHVNSCNGKTVIGDQAISSKANQLILFGNEPHYGTTQTDTDTRVVINFNLITD